MLLGSLSRLICGRQARCPVWVAGQQRQSSVAPHHPHRRGGEIPTIDGDPTVLAEIEKKEGFIVDMDGVLYDGGVAIDGAARFLHWLESTGKRFLLLTNSSGSLPAELSAKVKRILGVSIPGDNFYTSGQST